MTASAEAGRADDERFMRLALALGDRHLGLTWPNPSVGAVVVRGGPEPVIVGQGVTQRGGRPHAERVALAMAGEAARGGTLYVTLEPCSHHGRTPPCVDAVTASGVARVVVGLTDPDPRVAGRGLALLRAASIAVTEGIGAEAAARAHRGHVLRVTEGRPLVTLKLARTADGFAGRRDGPRLLITGAAANARTHLLRAHADAILVGIGTVLADDPLLTVRLPGLEDRSPVRIVLDPSLRTPPAARLAATVREVPTWIVAAEDAPREREEILAAQGVRVLRAPRLIGAEDNQAGAEPLPPCGGGQGGGSAPPGEWMVADRLQDQTGLTNAACELHHPPPGLPRKGGGGALLPAVLRLLAGEGLTRLFVEGGPTLAETLAAADLLDEVVLLTGPAPLGGPGLSAVGPHLGRALATRFRLAETDQLGQDRLERFEKVV